MLIERAPAPVANPADSLLGVQLKIARRADELARGYSASGFSPARDREAWLLAEAQILAAFTEGIWPT